MVCRSCASGRGDPLCGACLATLQRGPERRIDGGLLVSCALVHDGAARALVHNLKYRGVASAAALLAGVMAPLVPRDASCLVPVPRVLLRLWRYGVDPAADLATRLGAITGLPVIRSLARPLWWPGRAGPAGRARGAPVFRGRSVVPEGAVLVDDVLTTGATLAAAAGALEGVAVGVTASGPAQGSVRR